MWFFDFILRISTKEVLSQVNKFFILCKSKSFVRQKSLLFIKISSNCASILLFLLYNCIISQEISNLNPYLKNSQKNRNYVKNRQNSPENREHCIVAKLLNVLKARVMVNKSHCNNNRCRQCNDNRPPL